MASIGSRAYVMIETLTDQTEKVYDALSQIDAIFSVNLVTGPYDLIVLVEAEDQKKLGNVIIQKIRTIPGIMRTLTCVIVG